MVYSIFLACVAVLVLKAVYSFIRVLIKGPTPPRINQLRGSKVMINTKTSKNQAEVVDGH